MKRRNIALYGGSFDPPHLGHVITITAVLNSGLIDEIWLVPTGRHPDKVHHASCDHRKEMVSIMLATMFGSRVPVYLDTTQIDMPWVLSSSAGLIRTMERRHPSDRFFLVVGSDLIKDIPKWQDAGFLMKHVRFLAVRRLGDNGNKSVPAYVKLLDTDRGALTNISSSLVRDMVKRKESLEGVVPPAVISHILRNKLYAGKISAAQKNEKSLLYEGRFIRLLAKDGWEYVERTNCTGIAGIIAVTNDRKIIFIEQYRMPVGKLAIEFPAGLVNDTTKQNEHMITAAKRELFEETGYRASKWIEIIEGPISSGLTSEAITFFLATGLKKVAKGGGDESEAITVYEIPLSKAEKWLSDMKRRGRAVDPKVYAGLYFAKEKLI